MQVVSKIHANCWILNENIAHIYQLSLKQEYSSFPFLMTGRVRVGEKGRSLRAETKRMKTKVVLSALLLVKEKPVIELVHLFIFFNYYYLMQHCCSHSL